MKGGTESRRPAATRGELVTTSYLGYLLEISDRTIIVRAPNGRRMCDATSIKQARLLIRSYRRSSRELRVVGDLADRALPPDLTGHTR